MDGRLPNHIAIIMDGNGRWAKQRNRPRSFGHLEGLKTAKRIISHVSGLGIPFVTLYVFSTENWKRPLQEVSYLMGLITSYLKKEYQFYDEHDIRVTFSGDTTELPEEVAAALKETEDYTSGHGGTTVNLAINYGGRDELVRAVNSLPLKDGRITADDIASALDHPEIPDPDLVIRTAGERRLSNFLIWEAAYAELYFSPVLWPDWTAAELDTALGDYAERTRRFGGIVS